jgi:hypothetical protein
MGTSFHYGRFFLSTSKSVGACFLFSPVSDSSFLALIFTVGFVVFENCLSAWHSSARFLCLLLSLGLR